MFFRSDKARSWGVYTCSFMIFTFVSTAWFYIFTSLFPLLASSNLGHSFIDLSRKDGNPQQHNLSASGAKTLRILTLGASIMSGSLTLDENGFRKVLRQRLVSKGFKVNMVGNRAGGTMPDNQVTAWGGYRIDEVAKKGELSYAYMPNLVIINCGSNDFFQNFYITTAPDRLEALVNRIFDVIPGSTVIVSTLLPNYSVGYASKFAVFNTAVKAMVARKQKLNQKVALADFTTSEYSIADIRPPPDGTHPTDAGYFKMAGTWFDSIMNATALISEPNDNGIPNYDEFHDTTCQKTLDSNQTAVQNQENTPGIADDGNYVHEYVSKGDVIQLKAHGASAGQISTGTVGDAVFWADINGDGLDDYVFMPDSNTIAVALNQGGGIFGTLSKMVYGGTCSSRDAIFADFNADGRADFFCLSATGALNCWLNSPGSDDNSTVWTGLGVVKEAVTGYSRVNTRLGDIDGDGRADFITLQGSGDIFAWRNSGVNNTPSNWTDMGVIKPSNVGIPLANLDVQFVDINGDGRDDLLAIDDDGNVHTLINQRGYVTGLVPDWLDAGLTHNYTNTGINSSSEVKFGRIWDSVSAAGYAMADYTKVTSTGTITTWQNTGQGGTRLKGDGVRYCDMFGHKFDDYIWMDHDGSLTLFGNTQTPPTWKPYGKIHPGGIAPRNRVHLSDIDGDGLCDYVVVSEGNGTVQWMRNLGFNTTSSSFDWATLSNAWKKDATHPVAPNCEWGSVGVRFADVTGYGFPDYLCVAEDGSVGLWMNLGNNWWRDKGHIKSSEGFERSEIAFADIDGNGRADYLAISAYTGAVAAWTNGNDSLNSVGHAWNFTSRGTVVAAVGSRGSSRQFANLGGFARADALDVVPKTADARVWRNLCVQSSAGRKGVQSRGLFGEEGGVGMEMWWGVLLVMTVLWFV